MNTQLKWTMLGIFLAFAGWAALPLNPACAGTIAAQTCDTQVWKTMEARARIETEREIMQNQNLIFKPDSILNYVCFDSMAGHAAAQVGVLFTHTNYWNKLIIPWGNNGKSKGMDSAINDTVIKSLTPYFSGNFAHAYLGGRAIEFKKDNPDAGNGSPPVPVNANQSSSYACSEMAKVWATAKCANFLHTANLAANDGFYPYLNLTPGPGGGQAVAGYQTKNDTRKYPKPCTDATPLEGSTWEKEYRLSRNEAPGGFGDPNKEYKFGEPLQEAFKAVRDKVEPGSCATGGSIKTGVTVILGPGASGATYQDGVCTNPGCTYQKSGTCQ